MGGRGASFGGNRRKTDEEIVNELAHEMPARARAEQVPAEPPAPVVPEPAEPRQAPTQPESGALSDRIHAAYQKLATRPRDYVSLTDLRRELGDVPRADIDEALRQFNLVPGVTLAPEEDQKLLTPQDRDAALRIGIQDVHLLTLDPPRDTAPPAPVSPEPPEPESGAQP